MTIVILLYTFTVGLLIPLKPGITSIDHDPAVLGESLELLVTSYNTSFEPSMVPTGYLKLDSIHILKSSKSKVLGSDLLQFVFDLPAALPFQEKRAFPTLVISVPHEGYLVLPSALAITDPVRRDVDFNGAERWNDRIAIQESAWKFQFPYRSILYETIRNTFYHVAIWMAMFVLIIIGLIYSIKYLRTADMYCDAVGQSFTFVAVIFGCIGMVTGSVWAKNTWGTYWTDDPKLNLSAVAMIIYAGYLILRASIKDEEQRARLSAVYNVFAFVAMIPLIFIIPRLTSSLHPGNGGNPALGGEDLDSTLRLVFYPTIIGYTLMGVWIASLLYRLRVIDLKMIFRE